MEAIVGIAIFFVAVIQIMMVVKFFEIASDMKDIRNMLAKFMQNKSTDVSNIGYVENKPIECTPKKIDSPKITWQSWVALIIIIAGLILYFTSS